MSYIPDRCSKCNGQMQQGFVMDMTRNGRLVSQWGAGKPIKSFWVGTKLPAEKLVPIGAFRCTNCGFLECYARNEFAAE